MLHRIGTRSVGIGAVGLPTIRWFYSLGNDRISGAGSHRKNATHANSESKCFKRVMTKGNSFGELVRRRRNLGRNRNFKRPHILKKLKMLY